MRVNVLINGEIKLEFFVSMQFSLMFLPVCEILITFYPVLHKILGKKQLHVNTFKGD